jgi:glycosyltransferase involved in cell wall biosynthesis
VRAARPINLFGGYDSAVKASNLRVLMLTPDVPFLDRRIAQEGATLANLGHTVDILPVFGRLETSQEELAPGVTLLQPGVTLLQSPDHVAARRSRSYRAVRDVYRAMKRSVAIGRLAVRTYELAGHVRSAFVDRAGIIASGFVGPILDGARYDVVFAHDIPVLPLAVRLREGWDCAVVCDLHEIFPDQDEIRSRWWKAYWRRIERDFLPQVDGIVCVNAAVKAYVRKTVHSDLPIGVVHNSVPFNAATPVPGEIHRLFGIEEGQRVLVYAGSLRPNANLELLISSFAHANVPGWVLALVGVGSLESHLAELVNDLHASSRIALGKRVSQPDLIRVLSSADAGVLPYGAVGYHLIATPNKLFEYVQARLPLATTRLPEVERLIGANKDGVYLDFTIQETAASALKGFLMRTPEPGQTARLEELAHRLSWERDEAVLLDVFAQAVDRAQSGRCPAPGRAEPPLPT